MRTTPFLFGALLVACGGKTASLAATDEPSPPAALDCAKTVLTASPATTLLSIPEAAEGGLAVDPTSSLAVTPEGDTFFLVYQQGQAGTRAVVVKLTPGGTTVSPPVAVPPGTAAFDGQRFLVLYSPPDGRLGVQYVGLDGALSGPPVTGIGGLQGVALVGAQSPGVTVASGAAFTWRRVESQATSEELHVSVLGPEGTLVHDTVLSGPGRGVAFATVGVVGGRAYAWSCGEPGAPATLTDLGWSGEAGWSSPIEGGGYCADLAPGIAVPKSQNPWPLLSIGGRMGAFLTSNDAGYAAGQYIALYEGAPGQAFAPVKPVPTYFLGAAADACGRVVTLATGGTRDVSTGTPPAMVAAAMAGSSPPITFDTGPSNALLAPTADGFAVFWFGPAPTSISAVPMVPRMATLTWE